MKFLLIILGLVSFSGTSLAQSQDSLTVAIARATVSNELINLRDSINLSLQKFDVRSKVVRSIQKKRLQTVRKELVHIYDLVELDLAEVTSTSQNSWTTNMLDRIRASAIMNRREHFRLTQIL